VEVGGGCGVTSGVRVLPAVAVGVAVPVGVDVELLAGVGVAVWSEIAYARRACTTVEVFDGIVPIFHCIAMAISVALWLIPLLRFALLPESRT
jgi:hypothetical protein